MWTESRVLEIKVKCTSYIFDKILLKNVLTCLRCFTFLCFMVFSHETFTLQPFVIIKRLVY